MNFVTLGYGILSLSLLYWLGVYEMLIFQGIVALFCLWVNFTIGLTYKEFVEKTFNALRRKTTTFLFQKSDKAFYVFLKDYDVTIWYNSETRLWYKDAISYKSLSSIVDTLG